MPHSRKTTQELIEEEEKKAEQVRARMAELKARQHAEDRKLDAHRKIVVGAAAIAHVKIDPQFRKELRNALNKAVTDPKQRAVIADLLTKRRFRRPCEWQPRKPPRKPKRRSRQGPRRPDNRRRARTNQRERRSKLSAGRAARERPRPDAFRVGRAT